MIHGRHWPTSEGNGPSANEVIYRVCDSGQPPLCCTASVRVIVREVNTAPVIAAITNRSIPEGFRLVITNVVTDGDLPAQKIAWRFGPGAPTNATLNATNGLFVWRPAADSKAAMPTTIDVVRSS